MHTAFSSERPKGRVRLEDLSVDGQWNRAGGCGLDSSGWIGTSVGLL